MQSHRQSLSGAFVFGSAIALTAFAHGCGEDAAVNDLTPEALLADLTDESDAGSSVEGYPRFVDAKGAFTCDLTLVGDYPPAQLPGDLERARMVMTRAYATHVKYIPFAFDPVGTTNGQPNIWSGGRYLFK